jgi:hypothetical protein
VRGTGEGGGTVVRGSLYGSVVVVLALVLAFAAVALTLKA